MGVLGIHQIPVLVYDPRSHSILWYRYVDHLLGLDDADPTGMFYNHQQYSARGWDLVPHRDFWRELPTLGSDLVHHVSTNVRGGGSRGGYNSLG